jgi:UDP-glucose 4-epimerase
MQLNSRPEPEVKPLGPDDAPSILLDPSRTFADYGAIEFTPLAEIARRAVSHWREHGVQGGYTHLTLEKSER